MMTDAQSNDRNPAGEGGASSDASGAVAPATEPLTRRASRPGSLTRVAPSNVGKRPSGPWAAWRKPLAIVGLTLTMTWLLVALLAPWIAPYDPLAQGSPRFLEPNADHWFGTDELGRDVFSRVLYGARISLPLAMMLVLLAGTLGSMLGAVAGFFGGPIDGLIMRLTDLVFAFPTIILAMVVVAVLGPGLINAVLAVALVAWPSYARVVRSLVLSAREAEYVSSARLLGLRPHRVIWQEIAPNVAGPVLVLATLELGNAVLLLAGLSFLGLGAQPPAPEWGSMVAFGARAFDRWWLGMFPGLAILSVVLAFNFLGDSLRDALDPRAASAIRDS
jgi:peptide/nickel transport system permease protein